MTDAQKPECVLAAERADAEMRRYWREDNFINSVGMGIGIGLVLWWLGAV